MARPEDRLPRSWLPHGFSRYVSWRDMAVAWAPAVVVIGIAFGIAYHFVKPAPPRTVTLETGTEDGSYWAAARRYKEILARNGIELTLKRSSGSVQNLNDLTNRDDTGVDVAFVQSGVGKAQDAPDLVSLGSLFYEPVWVFYRSRRDFDQLSELRDLRIAVGPPGSGTRRLATSMLASNGLWGGDVRYTEDSGKAAVKALKDGSVDVVFLVSSPDARSVQALLAMPGVKLMNFVQAEAYARQFPFLSAVVLPAGALDLGKNRPHRDIHMVATTANLVAHEDLHPALASLFAAAALEVHAGPGLFNREGEFPSIGHQDFPMSDEAARYYKSGPPFLQRFLPFWAAVLINRLFILVLPLVALAIPLVRILPPLYNWRISSRIYRNYGELRMLEADIAQEPTAEKLKNYLQRLDQIELRINRLPVPLAFNHRLYTLREHINLVRGQIARLRAPD